MSRAMSAQLLRAPLCRSGGISRCLGGSTSALLTSSSKQALQQQERRYNRRHCLQQQHQPLYEGSGGSGSVGFMSLSSVSRVGGGGLYSNASRRSISGGFIGSNSSRRQMSSIVDKIQSKLEQRNTKKQGDSFRTQLRAMRDADKYDLGDFLATLDQESGWWQKVPGLNKLGGGEQMQRNRAILNAFTEEERADPSLIHGGVRKRVAETSGEPEEQVAHVLENFRQANAIYNWIQARKKKGERIPKSMGEFNFLSTKPGQTRLAQFINGGERGAMKQQRSRKRMF